MALSSGQPVGDLCDLLGVSRFNPGVFDAMIEILEKEGSGSTEAQRDARLSRLASRARR